MSDQDWIVLSVVAVFAYIFVAGVNPGGKNKIKKLDEEKRRLLAERGALDDDN